MTQLSLNAKSWLLRASAPAILLAAGCVPPTGSALGSAGLVPPPPADSPDPGPTATVTPAPSPVPLLSYTRTAFGSGEPYPYPQFHTTVGRSITLTPSHSGFALTDCTISPALPAGLTFSAADCSISGTPIAAANPVLYVVTAYNGADFSTTLLSLGVSPSGTAMIATPQTTYLTEVGQSMSIQLELGGGAVAGQCQISWVPSGFSANQCTLTGTPSQSDDVYLGSNDQNMPVFHGYEAELFGYRLNGGTWYMYGAGQHGHGLHIEAVAPASQPMVSYGGTLPYTQASLTAGTPVLPITPTNAGASIDACVASPALPAGLELSQTDCSITGNPSATSSPTYYTLTPSHGGVTGNPLTINIAVGPANVHALKCQSPTLCVHDQMPLWDQSDPALTAYINGQTGLSLSGDPGWCGGVSGAVILKTYIDEIQTYSSLVPKTVAAPLSATMTEYPFIYNTMQVVGTNIQYGGTDTPPNTGMVGYLGKCMQTDLLYSNGWTFPYTTLPWENVLSFRQAMPLGWLAICSQAGGISNCHALAVNGTEGSYFKVYDPWGTIFDASIDVSFPAPAGNNNDNGVISYIGGDTTNFTEVESAGHAMLFSTDWISRYVYTEKGLAPLSQCQP